MSIFEKSVIKKSQITGSIQNINDHDATTWERKIIERFIIDPDGFTIIIDHDNNTLRAL